jgi:hypothetical protein
MPLVRQIDAVARLGQELAEISRRLDAFCEQPHFLPMFDGNVPRSQGVSMPF